MPIKTIKRILNISDPFEDFIEHSWRILAFCKTIKSDAKHHRFGDIKKKVLACKRIHGNQIGRNSQQLITLWRKKFNQIHHLPDSAQRTHLIAMLEEMKDWLEKIIKTLHAIGYTANEATKIHAPKPNLSPQIEQAEKEATKILARANEIRKLFTTIKKRNHGHRTQSNDCRKL